MNPDASPEAVALLRQLDQISGKSILSGEHNYPNTISRYSDRVLDLTGKYPSIFGQDFGFSSGEDKDSILSRPAMIREVIRQYRAGSIPALCWHAVPPTQDEPVTFRGSILSHLSDWEFQQLLTPGTELHTRWEQQVDRIAGYLRELQDAGVPVLFRPYHEMNGNWFWWGGRPGNRGTAELYRMLFDRYVHLHHLNNLIWVWNVAAASSKSGYPALYWPGPQYVDVVSMDIYRPFTAQDYNSVLSLAGPQKPMALAEVGTLPDLATLALQPRWTYFMVWSEFAEDHNTLPALRTIFSSARVLNRGDSKPLLEPVETVPVPPPSNRMASAEANVLLRSLHARSQALQEINLAGLTQDQFKARLREVTQSGAAALVRWEPPSPTGSKDSLDTFEWAELRRPGTALHEAWLKQVRELASLLSAAGSSPFLLSVLPNQPGSNWWSRPGVEGSQELRAEVYDELAKHGRHNVLWAWEIGTPAKAEDASLAYFESYFPGPLHVDAFLLGASGPSEARGLSLQVLHSMAADQPVGIRETPGVPEESGSPVDFVVRPADPR